MNSIKLLAAIAALGLVATPAMSQSTNTMGNSMGGMSSGSMDKGMMDKGMMHKDMGSKPHMMPMNHKGMSKKTIAMCHKMSHARMMKNHRCRGMMKHAM